MSWGCTGCLIWPLLLQLHLLLLLFHLEWSFPTLGTIQSTHLDQNQLGSEPQAIFSSTLGTEPTPKGWCQALNIEETAAHMRLWLSSPSTPYCSDSCQHTLGGRHDSRSPPKALDTHTDTQPYKRHPSRPGWVTALPNFREREREKLMENEKTRNLFWMQEQGKSLCIHHEITHPVSHQELLTWIGS